MEKDLEKIIKAVREKKWLQNMIRQALEVERRGWGHIHMEILDGGKKHNLDANKKWHHEE